MFPIETPNGKGTDTFTGDERGPIPPTLGHLQGLLWRNIGQANHNSDAKRTALGALEALFRSRVKPTPFQLAQTLDLLWGTNEGEMALRAGVQWYSDRNVCFFSILFPVVFIFIV